jgi:CubicO group peptidase (beta-lactamase class C family)
MPTRRAVIAGFASLAAAPALGQEADPLAPVIARAEAIAELRTLIVAQAGNVLTEEGFRGHKTTAPTNIKSASKSIISAMVGIAIGKGLLEGPNQKIADFLSADFPENPDPRLNQVTIGNLLTMQAGLEPTSGANYGSWVASRNWVRAALAKPFVADPGTGWQYSTGSAHLLSAILTKAGKASTLDLLEEWFAPVEGFAVADWERDPQGIYLGGNQMAMSPHSLLAFGDLYRRRGKAEDSTQVVPEAWIDASWTPHARSFRNGDDYGYLWFLRRIGGEQASYAWGYGGQMCYVVPARDLVIVMTSDETGNAPERGYLDNLHDLAGSIVTALPPPAAGARP